MAFELDKPEINQLCEAIASTDNPETIKRLLEDLCTIREIIEMAQRYEVARMLSEGTTYTSVRELTGASAPTISRVSKCLKYGSGGYREVLNSNKSKNEE